MIADSYAQNIIDELEYYGIHLDSNYKDQHFMICQDVINSVAEAAKVSKGDYVLEIGPGLGQLTKAILERGARLVSIEIDKRFSPAMDKIKTMYPDQFEVIWGSALEVNWPEGINKIVMNPPFSILEKLLELIYDLKDIEYISMIIGKRYYQNSVERPGSIGYTKSALMTQAKFSPSLVMNIKADCFYPTAGEKCVVMCLEGIGKPNPVLRKLADFFVDDPGRNVKFVVNQVLELLNKRSKKYKTYENMITLRQIGLDDFLQNKRLQDVNNSELAKIVGRLTARLNYQRKR